MWRTGCEKNLEKALMRVSAISSSYGLEADVTEKNVMAVMDSIEDLMQKSGIRYPSSCGRGHHLSQEQKDWKKIREEKEKIRDYIIWIRKMKESGRNSLSKRGCDVHEDEGRPHAQWAAEGGIQYAEPRPERLCGCLRRIHGPQ